MPIYPTVSGCTDINECLYPLGLNQTYVKPTFRNLPGDDLTPTQYTSFYTPGTCPAGQTCVNVFYKNNLGYKCMESSAAKVAVVVAGHSYTNKVEVLKADLTRCDSIIAPFTYSVYYHEVG